MKFDRLDKKMFSNFLHYSQYSIPLVNNIINDLNNSTPLTSKDDFNSEY